MKNKMDRTPDFNDIVFEIRNKEYGAYSLRRNYNRNVIISIMIALFIMSAAVITPFINAKANESSTNRNVTEVQITIEQLEQPDAAVTPPPPPPPPTEEVTQQVKYVPPVVVDTLDTDEATQLMTAEDAIVNIQNDDVTETITEIITEVTETEKEPEPFIVVEEMPVPPGGVAGLLKFIAENIDYPEIARENNVQGKVIVRFCVTSRGGVDQVSIYKGVDPELDAEAIRVVKTLPPFKPGRQGGKPVPVWFSVPINFQLKTN